MSNPTIIVIAYNRINSLKRLLTSLLNAKYSGEVRLVISIDNSGNDNVYRYADNFSWPFGEKKIIKHPERLGLKEHVLVCGDLVNKYECIIMLEDDIYVSPYFYDFTQQALEFYSEDENVGGVSLYNHCLNVNTRFPFIPLHDGYDIYFLQFASSWGQAWCKNQWNNFRKWLEEDDKKFNEKNGLPQYVNNWPETSWLKYFNMYLVQSKKYFVYPRISLSTNFTDAGTNNKKSNAALFQVNLLFRNKKFNFVKIQNSLAVYDSHFEINPDILKNVVKELQHFDLDVSLNLTKTGCQINSEYVITELFSDGALMMWSLNLKPPELNIINNIKGSEIFLIPSDIYKKKYF